MADEKKTVSPITLEAYKLEREKQEKAGVAGSQPVQPGLAAPGVVAEDSLPIKITLRGQCFMISSFDPKIMIGKVQLKDFETLSDQCTIVGYLYEIPEEGSVISIDYGEGRRAELPERFSLKRLH